MPNEKKSEENSGKEKAAKLKQKRMKTIIAIAVLAVIGAAVFYNYYSQPSSSEYHYASAFGIPWAFRADLRDAEKVSVSPTEDSVYYELFSIGDGPFVKNITLVFKDAGYTENPYYQTQGIEIAAKLKIIYQLRYPNAEPPTFNTVPVDSYENLPGKMQNPIIAMVHPKFATETSIKVENHVITLNANTLEDMDSVTAKLLMIALQLKRAS